jgi:hypothetical protein
MKRDKCFITKITMESMENINNYDFNKLDSKYKEKTNDKIFGQNMDIYKNIFDFQFYNKEIYENKNYSDQNYINIENYKSNHKEIRIDVRNINNNKTYNEYCNNKDVIFENDYFFGNSC